MTPRDVASMIANMGRLAGRVRTEAETCPRITRSGEPYVGIREITANDLLASLAEWRGELSTLLDDKPVETR